MSKPPETCNRSLAVGVRQALGSLALFSGVAILILLLIDNADGLPFAMPRSWYLHRALWGAFGGVLLAAGWRMQRSSTGQGGWKPRVPGQRFESLVIYTREDCHLCDDAKGVLAKYLEYLPDIEEIDIDTDSELVERYGTKIPVIEFDGRAHFFGQIDEHLLRRLIEGRAKSEE